MDRKISRARAALKKPVENFKCRVSMMGAERWWQGRGWQHTLRNVQSTSSLASNAVEK